MQFCRKTAVASLPTQVDLMPLLPFVFIERLKGRFLKDRTILELPYQMTM